MLGEAETPADTKAAEATGRAATEAALEDAALRLLERDGVLAGLNLREVADEAGVNRGLVYHYYGSRAKLLRRALARAGRANMTELNSHYHLRFIPRMRAYFKTSTAHPKAHALTSLLIIDGTERFRTMPLKDRTRAALEESVEAGDIAADVNLTALHAFMVSAMYGYSVYRDSFAQELGVTVEELDQGVESLLFDRLYPTLAMPPPGAKHKPSRRGIPRHQPAGTRVSSEDKTTPRKR